MATATRIAGRTRSPPASRTRSPGSSWIDVRGQTARPPPSAPSGHEAMDAEALAPRRMAHITCQSSRPLGGVSTRSPRASSARYARLARRASAREDPSSSSRTRRLAARPSISPPGCPRAAGSDSSWESPRGTLAARLSRTTTGFSSRVGGVSTPRSRALEEQHAGDLERHYAALGAHYRAAEHWERAARYLLPGGRHGQFGSATSPARLERLQGTVCMAPRRLRWSPGAAARRCNSSTRRKRSRAVAVVFSEREPPRPRCLQDRALSPG